MDGNNFDNLSRVLGGISTRRGAIRAALGLVVAGGLATQGMPAAAGEIAPVNCPGAGKPCRTGRRPISCCDGLVCEKSICRVPAGGNCQRNSNCVKGQVCRPGGVCAAPGDNGDACSMPSHCKANLVCNRSEKVCRLKPNATCADDTSCGAGFTCDDVKRKCVPMPKGTCVTNADCPGALCMSGSCSQSCTNIPGTCYVSTEGLAGGSPLAQSGIECTSASDCTAQSICTGKPEGSICVCIASLFDNGASLGDGPFCGYMTLPT